MATSTTTTTTTAATTTTGTGITTTLTNQSIQNINQNEIVLLRGQVKVNYIYTELIIYIQL